MLFANVYFNVLFYALYILTLTIGIEMFSYFWHRYGAHADYIPGVHDTHRIHHIINTDNADEDFVWICLLLILAELILGIGVMINVIPGTFAIITIIVSITVFWWNWWIHKAYHNETHWLNNYDWFSLEKERHFEHHKHINVNYGIASHFMDKFMNTWIEPSVSEINKSENGQESE